MSDVAAEIKNVSYVIGLLFNDDCSSVILVKKNRPDILRGLLNGVGGKIEPNEYTIDAMVREFEEEAGVYIPPSWWRFSTVLTGIGYTIYCYACRSSVDHAKAHTCEDEVVQAYEVDKLVETDCAPEILPVIKSAREMMLER